MGRPVCGVLPTSGGTEFRQKIPAGTPTAIRSAECLAGTREVRVRDGRFYEAMNKESTDDWQTFAERARPRGEGVAEEIGTTRLQSRRTCGPHLHG